MKLLAGLEILSIIWGQMAKYILKNFSKKTAMELEDETLVLFE